MAQTRMPKAYIIMSMTMCKYALKRAVCTLPCVQYYCFETCPVITMWSHTIKCFLSLLC